jgi:transposase-like protein
MTGNIIEINEEKVKDHLGKFVRQTVEETLNAMLDAEADNLCKAQKYERSEHRKGTRAGHYERKLLTRAGEVNLKMPKLRKVTFETAIIERYKRREISVEEAMIEMYLAGVSVRRVEDITEALWGTKVSPGTISNLNKKIYDEIGKWRMEALKEHYTYVYLDGIWLKRSWGGEVKNVSVLVAVGVNEDGFREIIGVAEGTKEDKESWRNFLRYLKERQLKKIDMIVSDKALGLVESIPDFYPEAKWQRCVVHFYRNVFSSVPPGKLKEVATMLKAIHAQENIEEARRKRDMVVVKLKEMKLPKAAELVNAGTDETLSYYSFPVEHWKRIRTNNGLERIMKEIRRRTRVVGAFPDGESALMLVAARLRHIAGSVWSEKKYLNMELLYGTNTDAIAS